MLAKTINGIGDSRVIVDWAAGSSSLNMAELDYWCERIKLLQSSFHRITFQHISRKYDAVADRLSKKALGLLEGRLFIEEFCDNSVLSSGSFLIILRDFLVYGYFGQILADLLF